MKEYVKKILKSNALGRIVYKPLHKLYRLYSIPHRRRVLRRHGAQALQKIEDVATRHQLPIFAAFGTLLGIVRERGFIRHDEDIDLGVMPGSITPEELLAILLGKEKGFSFAFGFSYKGRITELKFYCEGIPVDFFFFEEVGGRFRYEAYAWQDGIYYPNDRANSVRYVYQPAVSGLKMVRFLGIEFPVPVNAEDVLEGLYGKTWRVPNSKWSEDDRPKYEQMKDFGYLVRLDDIRGANYVSAAF